MNCPDDKGRVKVKASTENALMTMDCFCRACRNGSLSYVFGYLLFVYHCSSVLICLLSCRLYDVGVFECIPVSVLSAMTRFCTF